MAMGISAEYAYRQLRIYKEWVEDIKEKTPKNYKDMDFENADKWEDMGELVQGIVTDCESVIDDMRGICFEE